MPQRVLSKNRPWVFIPDNTMLQDDSVLIDQQLRQAIGSQAWRAQGPASNKAIIMEEGGPEDIASIVNKLAFKGVDKFPEAGSKKRNRNGDMTAKESPKKRVAGEKRETRSGGLSAPLLTDGARSAPAKRGRPKKALEKFAAVEGSPMLHTPEGRQGGPLAVESVTIKSPASTKPVLGKLGRPNTRIQEMRRPMIDNPPAVAPVKKVRNVYGMPEDKPAVSKTARKLRPAPQAKPARTSARRIKTIPAIPDSTTAIEGHSSAIFNGRAESGGEPQGDSRKTRKWAESSESAPLSAPADEETGAERAEKEPRHTRASEREKGVIKQPEVTVRVEVQGRGQRESESEDEHANHERPSQAHNGDDDNNNNDNNGEDDEDEDEDQDDEEDQQSLDLLGEEKEWKKVLDAARSICGKKLLKNTMPTLLTTTIENLVLHIQEARKLYEQLLPFAGMDHDQIDGLREQLQESLTAIEEQINDDDISERTASTNKSRMIQDIYGGAIPAMALLLKAAFAYHTVAPNGLRNYESLLEITRLQDMTISLCEKATSWEAKPCTNRPIINPTKRVIFPYLLRMRKEAFENELREQRRVWKNKQNALKTARREEEELEQAQWQKESSLPSTAPSAGRIMEDILRNRIKWRGSRDTVGLPRRKESADVQLTQPSPRTEQPRTNTKWTEEEIRVLFRQLEDGYIPDQAGT